MKRLKNLKMKRTYRKLIGILLLIGVVISSCDEYTDLLEKEETGDLDLKAVYSDIRNAEQALSDLYNRVYNYTNPDGHFNNCGKFTQSCMVETFSIYGSTTAAFAHNFKFNVGEWSPSSNYYTNRYPQRDFGDFYRFDYAAIRACNLFIENIEKVPFDAEYGFSQTEQQIKKAEAKFLNAFFHMDLLRNYGAVIIVDHVLTTTDSLIQGQRNTYDEFVQFIVNECDEAAAVLPGEWSSSQLGRVTKGAAMSLKAQALIYAASPLANNPNKPDDSPFRGKYDPDKWNIAAQACADVIQLNQYELEQDITKIFNTVTNKEVIFARMCPPGHFWEFATLPCYIGWRRTNGGRNQMTYSYMKYYKVIKDGKAYDQDDPASGFDLQNPFVNLDPRFYRDVAYNGANLRQNRIVELWALGENTSSADKAANLAQRNTYLHSIKMCDLDINPLRGRAGGVAHHNFQHLRYADILLMYAEAMNEAYGPDNDALGIGLTATEAVNLIRVRTKCLPYPEFMGYTYEMPLMETGMSKEAFREELRKERMIEMGFEDHIFYDIRRWRVDPATQRMAYILRPTLYRDEPEGPTKIRYELVEDPRAFETSWYLLPIPEPELIKNPNMVQNPGWSGSPESEN